MFVDGNGIGVVAALGAGNSGGAAGILNINSNSHSHSQLALPPLYIITPTYYRAEQLPELTRLSHTLMLVPNVHWLVIEDAHTKSPLVGELLERTSLKFSHLVAPMPDKYKKRKVKPRGVSNRNRGLQWIREHASNGVFYFADDDNTYDLRLFEQVRSVSANIYFNLIKILLF